MRTGQIIRDRTVKLAALETRRTPTAEERTDLRQVPDAVADELTPRALEELTGIVDIVSDSEKPPKVFRAKLVNSLNKIGGSIDSAQKSEKRATWLVKLAGRFAGWCFKQGD